MKVRGIFTVPLFAEDAQKLAWAIVARPQAPVHQRKLDEACAAKPPTKKLSLPVLSSDAQTPFLPGTAQERRGSTLYGQLWPLHCLCVSNARGWRTSL